MFGVTREELISGLVSRTDGHAAIRVEMDDGAYVVRMLHDRDGWIPLMTVDAGGVVRAIDGGGRLPHAFLSLLDGYLDATRDR